MATEYALTVTGQPYFNHTESRSIPAFYTIPDRGVTSSTGILLLISGFEGDTSANVYKKMRMEFSDQQDLIVVQCDYFGFQFMGSDTMLQVHQKMEDMVEELNQHTDEIDTFMPEGMRDELTLSETSDCFCELGIFQALDNLRVLKKVMMLLSEQGLEYNNNRIIAYGYSHGAYLSLLCNAFAPNLFSGILDNSGWIYPVYLYRSRICSGKWSDSETQKSKMLYVFINYMGRTWIDDLEVYNLRRLYSQFENHANILSFHGEDDGLVPLKEKLHFLEKVENSRFYVVQEKDVDHKIFNNTQHGMGSNFLALFYFVSAIERFERPEENKAAGEELWNFHSFSSRKYQYNISSELEISRVPLS